MTSDELRRLRSDILAAMAAWPPEKRQRLLGRLPKWQREGWARLIEEHQGAQK